MSDRKPGYVAGVVFLSLVLSLPQIALGIGAIWIACSYRTLPIPMNPALGRNFRFHNKFTSASFWKDGFVSTGWKKTADGKCCYPISIIDPETGAANSLNLELPGDKPFVTFAVGDRIWFVRTASDEAYEIVDDVLQKTKFELPILYVKDRRLFWWNDNIAYTNTTATGIGVSILTGRAWKPVGDLVLPDFSRDRILGGTPIRANRKKLSRSYAPIDIVNSNDGMHIFLDVDGHLLYHKGFELKDQQNVKPAAVVETETSRTIQSISSTDEPNSTNNGSYSDDDLAGWSLVRDQATQSQSKKRIPNAHLDDTYGFLIEGVPFAMFVDDLSTGQPIGHLYRFNGTSWSEIASQPFPFGSCSFRIVHKQDHSQSYVVAITSIGVAHFFAVDQTGFRKTNAIASDLEELIANLLIPFVVPIGALGLGILLGGIISCLMWWRTKPDYEAGSQSIRLASLGRRGFSRLIDLGLITLTTLAMGWVLTLNLDWVALADSLNMRIPHPSTDVAARVAAILAAWLFVITVALIMSQAAFGVTPGKWLCRLRTVRTSLRPCGFARSLTREILLFVDCFNFVCWTPGIASIAVTDRRQRLGDMVADTIVVESRSMTNVRPR